MDENRENNRIYDEVKYITISGVDRPGKPNEPEKPGWHIYEALIALFAVVGFTVIVTWLIGRFFPSFGEGLLTVISSPFQTLAFIVAAYYIAKSYHRKPLEQLGLRPCPLLKPIKKGLAWGFLLYLLSVSVSVFISLFYQSEEDMQEIMRVLAGETNDWIRIGLMIAIIVLAPLGEELFFRGFLYTAFRERLGVNPAIAISGAIFAAMHLDLLSFLPLFAVGMGLAFLYQKYQNLWYNMAAHAVFNSISMILFFTLIDYV